MKRIKTTLVDSRAALGLAIALLLMWEIASRSMWVSPLLFPAPSRILLGVRDLWIDEELWLDISLTLFRFGAGFGVGSLSGLLLGMLMGWYKPLNKLLSPFVSAFHPVPKIALLPLIIVVFGIGETSKILVVSVGAFFPVLINTIAGIKQIEPAYLEAARNYGADWKLTFVRVLLPASLPSILSGVLLAANISLLITIAVEIVSGRGGLGSVIWFAWETMRPINLYAALLVIILLGILIQAAVAYLDKTIVPWKTRTE